MSGKSLNNILKGFKKAKASERTIGELGPVLFQPLSENKNRPVYKVWRNLTKKGDAPLLKKLKIHYDITLIFPKKLGRELPKTFGHYHLRNRAGIGYPEVYEVLKGRGWWLLQKPENRNPKAIEKVYLVEAREREKVIIPPGFGHSLANPGDGELVAANWIGEFKYDYESYENLRGAAYYLLESKDGKSVELEKNSYYEKVPGLVKLRPKEIPALGILKSKPLYGLAKTPEKLEFLIKPKKYLNLLKIENCFKRI